MAVLTVKAEEALNQLSTDALIYTMKERVAALIYGGTTLIERDREQIRADITGNIHFHFRPSLLGLVPEDEVNDMDLATVDELESELKTRFNRDVAKERFEKELQERVSNPISRRDLICDIFGLPHTASIATILQSVNEALL